MSHLSALALVALLAPFAVGPVGAQQADVSNAAAQPTSTPAANDAAPADPSSQSAHSTDARPTAAGTSAKQTQLPPVQVNAGPSEDILTSARDAGFKIKVANGKTHFCKTGAAVGTRFETESCMDEPTVRLWLERAQEQKDKLMGLKGAPTSFH